MTSNGTISMNLGTNFISVKFEIKGDCPNFADVIAIGNDTAMQAMAKAMSGLGPCERREDFDGLGTKINTVSTTTINDTSCSTIVTARFAGVAPSTLMHAANAIAFDTTAALSEAAHQQPSGHDQLIEQMAVEIVNGDYNLITLTMLNSGVNEADYRHIGEDLFGPGNTPLVIFGLGASDDTSGLDRHFASTMFGDPNRSNGIPAAAFMTATGDGPWG